MKTLTDISKKKEITKLKAQEGSLNFVKKEDLEKYLKVTEKFLSEEGKNIIKWLIDNNDSYVDTLARSDSENALASFINGTMPSEENLKELYRWCKAEIKNGTYLELPPFQTKEQFDSICSNKVSLDEIVLDLVTEEGRNKIAKKFNNMVWQIANTYIGKSELNLKELYAAGLSGLAWALNTYGRSTSHSKTSDEEIKSKPFRTYAYSCIQNGIREEIKNSGHTVRLPGTQQAKERKDTGKNTRTNTISLDTTVGVDKDGNTKTLMDKISNSERAGKNLDYQDIENTWNDIKKELEKRFDKKTLDIFYKSYGIYGNEVDPETGKPWQKKKIASMHNINSQSLITISNSKVINAIKSDKKLMDMFKNVYQLIEECKNDDEAENILYEPIYFTNNDDCVDDE